MHDLPVEEGVVLLQGGHGGLRGDVAVGSIGRPVLAPSWTSLTSGVHLQGNSWTLKQRNRGGTIPPGISGQLLHSKKFSTFKLHFRSALWTAGPTTHLLQSLLSLSEPIILPGDISLFREGKWKFLKSF